MNTVEGTTPVEGATSVGTSPVRAAADRPGRRALFEGDAVDAVGVTASDGLRPWFSAAPRAPGTVVVECSACEARTPVAATELALPVSLSLLTPWLLFARHPHRLRCPACGQRTWCRLV